MTLTPERLAAIKSYIEVCEENGNGRGKSIAEELLETHDDLNALLAAAESAVLMMSTKNSGELRAAIRRAKGEP